MEGITLVHLAQVALKVLTQQVYSALQVNKNMPKQKYHQYLPLLNLPSMTIQKLFWPIGHANCKNYTLIKIKQSWLHSVHDPICENYLTGRLPLVDPRKIWASKLCRYMVSQLKLGKDNMDLSPVEEPLKLLLAEMHRASKSQRGSM